jgi:3-deoxy-D-manno-octulosonate 8-phosphate phosphatase (KDO 8-P phosphatase)
MSIEHIKSYFKGKFLTEPKELQQKLFKAKAFVFDWDGVFNNGLKYGRGSSPFSEVDSMGINMLRFNHYLRTAHAPITIIISGERNRSSFAFARRENLNAVYYNVKNKSEALSHLCATNNISASEVAFFFDDVLDLAMAEMCGLRIAVGRTANPLFLNLVESVKAADYITLNDGNNNALREAAELLMGLSERYDETITERARYSEVYQAYLQKRNMAAPVFYTSIESNIIEYLP